MGRTVVCSVDEVTALFPEEIQHLKRIDQLLRTSREDGMLGGEEAGQIRLHSR